MEVRVARPGDALALSRIGPWGTSEQDPALSSEPRGTVGRDRATSASATRPLRPPGAVRGAAPSAPNGRVLVVEPVGLAEGQVLQESLLFSPPGTAILPMTGAVVGP